MPNQLMQLETLWAAYGRRARPADIGARVMGVLLGDLDDEVQDVVGSYAGMRADAGMPRAARLGLAYGEIRRVLPGIERAETRIYFEHLAELANAALESMREDVG
jgi:hypothetical protein